MGTCYFCGTPLDDDYMCFGCGEYICDDCDMTGACMGNHSPECHETYDTDLDDFD